MQIPYPLDYQRSLESLIRGRLEALRSGDDAEETARQRAVRDVRTTIEKRPKK